MKYRSTTKKNNRKKQQNKEKTETKHENDTVNFVTDSWTPAIVLDALPNDVLNRQNS